MIMIALASAFILGACSDDAPTLDENGTFIEKRGVNKAEDIQ